MTQLDMDNFLPTNSSSSNVSRTDSNSAAARDVAPADAFTNCESFPSPTGEGCICGDSSLDNKHMGVFVFPASPVKSQLSAFGFTPAAATPPADPYVELAVTAGLCVWSASHGRCARLRNGVPAPYRCTYQTENEPQYAKMSGALDEQAQQELQAEHSGKRNDAKKANATELLQIRSDISNVLKIPMLQTADD